MKPTAAEVHEAMQSAPFDGKPFRQARAALALVADRVAELERERAEMLDLLKSEYRSECYTTKTGGGEPCWLARDGHRECWEHRRLAFLARLEQPRENGESE